MNRKDSILNIYGPLMDYGPPKTLRLRSSLTRSIQTEFDDICHPWGGGGGGGGGRGCILFGSDRIVYTAMPCQPHPGSLTGSLSYPQLIYIRTVYGGGVCCSYVTRYRARVCNYICLPASSSCPGQTRSGPAPSFVQLFAEKYVPTKLNGKVSLLPLKVTDIRISCHGQTNKI